MFENKNSLSALSRRNLAPLFLSLSFLGGCVTNPSQPDSGKNIPKSTTSQENTNLGICRDEKWLDLLVVGFGFTHSDKDCVRAETVFTLMTKKNNDIDNLIGLSMYMDENPQVQKYLEERMGGKENVRIDPQIIVGLLTSEHEDSQSLGYQTYAYSPLKTRMQVSAIFKNLGIDFIALTSAIIAKRMNPEAAGAQDNYTATAKSWIKQNAGSSKPKGCAAGEKTEVHETPSGAKLIFQC